MHNAIDALVCWAVGAVFSATTIYWLLIGQIKSNKPTIDRRTQPWLYWLQIAVFGLGAVVALGMAIRSTILAIN